MDAIGHHQILFRHVYGFTLTEKEQTETKILETTVLSKCV